MELTSMLNIGKGIETKLKSVGIENSEDLIRLGSKETFLRLKSVYPNVCTVFLYSLQGAIDNIEYNRLSDEIKMDLKNFSDTLKNGK